MRALEDLACALGFLTVLPLPRSLRGGPGSFGRSFGWFPVAGLLLGAALAGAALAAGALFPPPVSAALVLALWVLLTGGLHLDGLMDACDGLFAARGPKERLEIMSDPHPGAFGVLGAGCLLLSKYGALLSLLGGGGTLLALLFAPALGRWVMAAAAILLPYGRGGEALGARLRRGAGRAQLALASGWMLAAFVSLCLLLRGAALPAAALAAGLAPACALCALALRRLPGLTGDVYGAAGELAEAGVLAAFAAGCCR
ncbi:cobalamin-5'-phosphate synthase [Rubrobacter xylanophilus DSM 9941]|uniref:Adenosylcobinamide-GDP ribazoletransferase n=1 Tax=Rubrobacter xylanophilus (strain DSM 9941 / JCM 11954 / NBRC 16129 / PRD-1) TaxID=266117 RepID=Q1AYB0_RUBXD|nr:adenosylcobinamide-GDP ribazoletransferase [Rubrobacter xylanophilus]ABG03618.1 cobalamin-5'-phosphate synthase [Rubrobacter xylanophilus DSM 9941]